MPLVIGDRIKAATNTVGTGTYTIGSASTGFENFSVIGDGNTTYYCCTDETDFEVGIGTYTASGTTLARTTILQSSNSDNAVDWGSGAKTIFCTQPADKAVFKDASGNIVVTSDVSLGVETPTSNRTITLPDASGTLPVFTTAPTGAITDGTDGQVLATDGSGGLSFTSPTEALISSGEVTNVSTIEFNNTVITGYAQYRIVLFELRPSLDNRQLRMRLGANNVQITGAYMQSEYQYGLTSSGSQRNATYNNGNGNTFYLAVDGNALGTGTGENFYGEILIVNPNQTNGYKHVVITQRNYDYRLEAMGSRISASTVRTLNVINYVRIFAESGNIAQAKYRVYGIL